MSELKAGFNGQSTVEVEYKGKKVGLPGDELNCYKGILAWVNLMEWLPYNPDAPMTAEEKLEFMRFALQYCGDSDFHISFVDGRSRTSLGNSILIDSQGEPYAYIDGDHIKSGKAEPNCICEVFDEMDEFSEIAYRRLKYAIDHSVEYKPVNAGYKKIKLVKKVRVLKRYGKFKEEWYKCLKCGQVWRLVHPKDSFRGIWRRVK